MTIKLHASVKQTASGHFVPMITARGSKGRMLGSWTPKGSQRDAYTFTNANAAQSQANTIALRVTLHPDNIFAVA